MYPSATSPPSSQTLDMNVLLLGSDSLSVRRAKKDLMCMSLSLYCIVLYCTLLKVRRTGGKKGEGERENTGEKKLGNGSFKPKFLSPSLPDIYFFCSY